MQIKKKKRFRGLKVSLKSAFIFSPFGENNQDPIVSATFLTNGPKINAELNYYFLKNQARINYSTDTRCGASCVAVATCDVANEWCTTSKVAYASGYCYSAGGEKVMFDENHNIKKYSSWNGSVWVEWDVNIAIGGTVITPEDGVRHFQSRFHGCPGWEDIKNQTYKVKTNP